MGKIIVGGWHSELRGSNPPVIPIVHPVHNATPIGPIQHIGYVCGRPESSVLNLGLGETASIGGRWGKGSVGQSQKLKALYLLGAQHAGKIAHFGIFNIEWLILLNFMFLGVAALRTKLNKHLNIDFCLQSFLRHKQV